MSMMRLPRVGDRTIFWTAFWVVSALLTMVVVVGFSPTSPFRGPPPQKQDVAGARAGRMIIDPGGKDCRQISFDNDTVEITGARTVPCVKPHQPGSSFNTRDAEGVLGSMRRAFKGE